VTFVWCTGLAQPDSNTQIYSYFAGVIAAKKILREYAKPVITYSEAVDEEEEGDEEAEGIIYEEEEGEEEEEEEEGDEE
jgi:transcription elongation factor Elf1